MKRDAEKEIEDFSDRLITLIDEEEIYPPVAMTALAKIFVSFASRITNEKQFDKMMNNLKKLYTAYKKIISDSPTQD